MAFLTGLIGSVPPAALISGRGESALYAEGASCARWGPDPGGADSFYREVHMAAPGPGRTLVMVTLALGVLIGAGIVIGLLLDWVRHPDLIPIRISQPGGESSDARRESAYRPRQR
jgi:hypothetical protein